MTYFRCFEIRHHKTRIYKIKILESARDAYRIGCKFSRSLAPYNLTIIMRRGSSEAFGEVTKQWAYLS